MSKEKMLHGEPAIKLNIHGDGQRGTIHLCSLYGCYDHISDVDMKKIDVAEFTCPDCNQVLNSKVVCEICGAPMVKFLMLEGGTVSICSRNGCKQHYVSFDDIYDEMRKFYEKFSSY
jgi:ssDNA-binding Zn-finger/Zn-ribbon topoisomerase 1